MKDEIINNVGETLGLNNWQAVAAIIGLTLKKKLFQLLNLITNFSLCLPLRGSLWLVQLEIPKEEATKGQKEGREEAG